MLYTTKPLRNDTSESISQCECKWNFYAGVLRKNVAIGVMVDINLSIDISFLSRENTNTHKILKGKMPAGSAAINFEL